MAAALPFELSRLFQTPDGPARDDAWADFVAAHSRLLLHVARSISPDHDAAMDGYAYVLERLREDHCRRLQGYVADGRSKFTTWLVVVARRLCLDFHRHRYGRARDSTPDAAAEQAARRPPINSTAFDGAPALSFDGTTLYIFSERPGGFGKRDLYVTTRHRMEGQVNR